MNVMEKMFCSALMARHMRSGREECSFSWRNAKGTSLCSLYMLDYCCYNKPHLVPAQEHQYHMDKECDSRTVWERFNHKGSVECPVKDLVPVNAADVPDGGENWDNYQASGSVLNHIKAEAEKKLITRMLQVSSKAKKKAFRKQERKRHQALKDSMSRKPDESTMSDIGSIISNQDLLPRPKVQPNFSVVKQDPSKAVTAINKQFRTQNLNMKSTMANAAPSETSSVINSPPYEVETASFTHQIPHSYAAVTLAGADRRSSSTTFHLSTGNSFISMMTAVSSQGAPSSTISRSSTTMSTVTPSYAAAFQGGIANHPPSTMSNSSFENSTISSIKSFVNQRPPNNTNYHQSTAMCIAASVASYNRATANEECFTKSKFPGLGHGRPKPIE